MDLTLRPAADERARRVAVRRQPGAGSGCTSISLPVDDCLPAGQATTLLDLERS